MVRQVKAPSTGFDDLSQTPLTPKVEGRTGVLFSELHKHTVAYMFCVVYTKDK